MRKMNADVREKLVAALVKFLNSAVELEEFHWNLQLIDAENLEKNKHGCTAIGSVKDDKFDFGFVLFKRSHDNANDDSMQSNCFDMNIVKVIDQAIEQAKKKQGPNMPGMDL